MFSYLLLTILICLLQELFYFKYVLVRIVDNKVLVESSKVFIANFPRTLESFRKTLEVDKNSSKRFIVFSKCNSTYDLDYCIESFGDVKSSKKCSFVR